MNADFLKAFVKELNLLYPTVWSCTGHDLHPEITKFVEWCIEEQTELLQEEERNATV